MKDDFTTSTVIILAAGDSQRMGTPKGLLDYNGKPFLEHQINCLSDLGFSEIIVVLGKDKNLYLEKVPKLGEISIAINHQPERGPFSSLQCGLRIVSESAPSSVFILPIDVPCPKKNVWEQMFDHLKKSSSRVSIPEFQGKKGHPVLLSEEFKNYLLTCKSDSRLDFEIRKQKAIVVAVDDENITRNINTLEEWYEFKVKK
ncbi:MAG: nucleotidyltransferase family protein [Candidatus Heimdallarchaeota archaeon]|nr:nucleotidyltransferase family protein [Candidatus Heimdallarchaeota archaeon]